MSFPTKEELDRIEGAFRELPPCAYPDCPECKRNRETLELWAKLRKHVTSWQKRRAKLRKANATPRKGLP